MRYALVMLLPIFVVFLPASAEFDLHGGWNCPTDDPTEAIEQYQETIETRNRLWDSYLNENPSAEYGDKSKYIITPALGYAGNFAECLKIVHNMEPDSIAKISPELRLFLEENYFSIDSRYPSFVKFVLDPHGTVKIPSPIQQYQDTKFVQCRNGLEPTRKSSSGIPICVTPETKIKLQKRGLVTEFWPYNQLDNIRSLYKIVDDKTYFIKYLLHQAKLEKMTLSKSTNSLIIELKNSGIGLLAISVPRDAIQSTDGNVPPQDTDFIVLSDGKEAYFDEISNDSERTLFINFKHGAKQIEIIGTFPI